MPGQSLYQKYRRFLPQVAAPVDLGQGFTPTVRSRVIGPRAGIADLRFKLESLNPSGSYKDRFAGLAIGMAKARGATRIVATSSGNTGAALAAAAAAGGLRCTLYVSENAPAGKLEQMMAYGATVLRVRQFTIDPAESALITAALVEGAGRRGIELFVTAYAVSPEPMEGIKTIAYELDEQVERLADVFVPVGGAGLFVATCRGFADLRAEGRATAPRLHVVQPAGNDTVATPLRRGDDKARPVSTSTRISGLGVGTVLDGHQAIAQARASGGQGYCIDEDRILEVQRRLAREEGILVEPAGATSVAGALDAAARGEIRNDGPVVCVLTGHGFKDPASLRAMGPEGGAPLITRAEVDASLDA